MYIILQHPGLVDARYLYKQLTNKPRLHFLVVAAIANASLRRSMVRGLMDRQTCTNIVDSDQSNRMLDQISVYTLCLGLPVLFNTIP